MKHRLNLNDLNIFFVAQGIDLSRDQLHQFELYTNLINNWASRSNLISKQDHNNIIEKHILPSALLFQCILPNNHDRIMDIGSGAGFPGVVFKILQPNIDMTLIDSAKKKYLFLLEVNELLSLNCNILHRRVETLKKDWAIKYDFIISRAVAAVEILWTWSVDLLKNDGALYTLKGETDDAEIKRLMKKGEKIHVVKPHIGWVEFSKHLENKIIVKVEK